MPNASEPSSLISDAASLWEVLAGFVGTLIAGALAFARLEGKHNTLAAKVDMIDTRGPAHTEEWRQELMQKVSNIEISMATLIQQVRDERRNGGGHNDRPFR